MVQIVDGRPSWDEYFMQMAQLTAQRSTCLRRKVGAVIVKDKHIIATGYNGAPRGLKHCVELGGCLREKLKIPSGQRHEPVSYTHLDVYKRQGHRHRRHRTEPDSDETDTVSVTAVPGYDAGRRVQLPGIPGKHHLGPL